MRFILVVAVVIVIVAVSYFLLSNKSNKHCDFVAAYEATKNPEDSSEKQLSLYRGYFEYCLHDPSFNYELWKLQNNIPEK